MDSISSDKVLYMTVLEKFKRWEWRNFERVLLTDTLKWGGGLSVTKHANGRDWWVIVKKHYKNKFYKFLLTPLGIQSMGYQLIGLDDPPFEHKVPMVKLAGSNVIICFIQF